MKPLVAALLLFVASANVGFPCSCVSLPPLVRLEHSSTVFVGELMGMTEKAGVRSYEFRVVELLKGAPAETLLVKSSGSSAACGAHFPKGSTYLVYADGPKANLSTHLCKGNVDANSAAGKAEIRALRDAK